MQRPALYFALIALAASACDETRTSNGPTTPRSSQTDGGASDGGGTRHDAGPQPTTPDAACVEMFQAMCEATQRCSTRLGFLGAIIEATMCHPEMQRLTCLDAAAAAAGGRQDIDYNAISACTATLRSGGCESFGEVETCMAVATGKQAIGQPCYETGECATGWCDTAAMCPGSCVALGAAGDRCANDEDCVRGFACNSGSVCFARKAIGADCSGDGECGEDDVCVDSKCAAPAPLGQACASRFDTTGTCAPGGWCRDATGGSCNSDMCQCTAVGNSGQPCANAIDGPSCTGELLCVNSACSPGGAANAACAPDNPCAVGQRCVADRCQPVKKAGESCGSTGQCPLLFHCDGVCKPGRIAGESCGPTSPCVQGKCESGTCERIAVGMACERTGLSGQLSSCVVGAHCAGDLCVADIPIGGDCSAVAARCGPNVDCLGGICVAECRP